MPEHNNIINYKGTNLFYTEDIDISKWPSAEDSLLLNRENRNLSPEELRIVKRLFLMTTKNLYSNLGQCYCNEPTIITTGKSFFENPNNFYSLLGIQEQQPCDPIESDGVMLRTALFPSSLTMAGKALSSNMFNAVSLTAIMDNQGDLHFYKVGGENSEIPNIEAKTLQQKMEGTIMVVPERPHIQRESWNLHSTGDFFDVGTGFVNRRIMTSMCQDPTTYRLGKVTVNLYKKDGKPAANTFSKLEPDLINFLLIKHYFQDVFKVNDLTLDGRIYLNGNEPQGLQIFDFKAEKQSLLNTALANLRMKGIDDYNHSDSYYRQINKP